MAIRSTLGFGTTAPSRPRAAALLRLARQVPRVQLAHRLPPEVPGGPPKTIPPLQVLPLRASRSLTGRFLTVSFFDRALPAFFFALFFLAICPSPAASR